MRARARRVALGCGAVLTCAVLAAGTFAWSRGLLGGPDFSAVASIELERSYADPALLARARELPSVRAYLDPGFVHQPNGSLCGPTSVADVVLSTGRTATPDGTLAESGLLTIFGVLPGGITLDDLADLARRALPGAEVEVVRPASADALRHELARVADASVRVIANFHRGPLFGRGGGHHSPVGGYLEADDLAVVLDTNESYHGPWLVDVDRLFLGVHEIDRATGRPRGLLVATLPN